MLVLMDSLVCPVCRGELAPRADSIRCTACERRYAIRDGIPDLTPIPPPDEVVQGRWLLWEELQRNGERAYDEDPPSSLSVGDRLAPRRFGEFCRLEGQVLDIGCGPQARPSYADAFEGELVGIDPLTGERPRRFRFVRGIAEFLPFPDASFDRVLFATSLDHVLSPERAVAEAARVVRPDGAVVVWLGEPEVPLTVGAKLREALRLLRAGDLSGIGARLAGMARRDQPPPPAEPTPAVPEGAIDPFHFAHPDAETVGTWLTGAGLTVTETDRPLAGNCFMRAVPRAADSL